MKHSRPSLASILIALVLLVSVAKTVSAQPKSRSETHQGRPAVQTATAQQQQSQVPLAAFESSQAALREALETIKTQAEAEWEQTHTENITWWWLSWLTALRIQQGLLVVGIAYTIFAMLQWTGIRRQADSAKRALHVDRPILIPDNFVFLDEMLAKTAKVIASPKPILNDAWLIKPLAVPVTFTLNNYGRRPAEIKKIVGRIAAVTKIDDIPIGDFSKCENWPIPRNVLRSGEPTTVSSPIGALLFPKAYSGWFSPDEQRDIINQQKILIAYGQICYSEVGAEALSFSDFFCMYSAFALVSFGRGMPLLSPDDRNKRHE